MKLKSQRVFTLELHIGLDAYRARLICPMVDFMIRDDKFWAIHALRFPLRDRRSNCGKKLQPAPVIYSIWPRRDFQPLDQPPCGYNRQEVFMVPLQLVQFTVWVLSLDLVKIKMCQKQSKIR